MMRFLIIAAVVVFVVLWIRRQLVRMVQVASASRKRPAERCVRLVPFYDAQNRKVVMIPEDELEPGMRKVRIPELNTEAYVSDGDRARRDT